MARSGCAVRLRAAVDANQKAIVAACRAMGATVLHTHQLGKGAPDLIVGFKGREYLLECKDGSKPPSARRLTPDEETWHRQWRGSVVRVVESVDDALAALGVAKWRSDE